MIYRKEIMMMNIGLTRVYVNSERYEALAEKQGFYFMHPKKIMRKPTVSESDEYFV